MSLFRHRLISIVVVVCVACLATVNAAISPMLMKGLTPVLAIPVAKLLFQGSALNECNTMIHILEHGEQHTPVFRLIAAIVRVGHDRVLLPISDAKDRVVNKLTLGKWAQIAQRLQEHRLSGRSVTIRRAIIEIVRPTPLSNSMRKKVNGAVNRILAADAEVASRHSWPASFMEVLIMSIICFKASSIYDLVDAGLITHVPTDHSPFATSDYSKLCTVAAFDLATPDPIDESLLLFCQVAQSTAFVPLVKYTSIHVDVVQYTDCGATMIMNLFGVVAFDLGTGRFNATRLASANHGERNAKLVQFYIDHLSFDQLDNTRAHEAFAAIVSGLDDVDYVDEGRKLALSGGKGSFMNLLENLTGFGSLFDYFAHLRDRHHVNVVLEADLEAGIEHGEITISAHGMEFILLIGRGHFDMRDMSLLDDALHSRIAHLRDSQIVHPDRVIWRSLNDIDRLQRGIDNSFAPYLVDTGVRDYPASWRQLVDPFQYRCVDQELITDERAAIPDMIFTVAVKKWVDDQDPCNDDDVSSPTTVVLQERLMIDKGSIACCERVKCSYLNIVPSFLRDLSFTL